eukprot:COSAG02_NODE_1143_length_14245_cov_5.202743_1_plen_157_part_00
MSQAPLWTASTVHQHLLYSETLLLFLLFLGFSLACLAALILGLILCLFLINAGFIIFFLLLEMLFLIAIRENDIATISMNLMALLAQQTHDRRILCPRVLCVTEKYLRRELEGMKLKALKKRARSSGVDEEQLEDADDADEVKPTVIQLILDAHAS